MTHELANSVEVCKWCVHLRTYYAIWGPIDRVNGDGDGFEATCHKHGHDGLRLWQANSRVQRVGENYVWTN